MVDGRTSEGGVEPAKLAARVARDVVEDSLLRLGQLGGVRDRRRLVASLESARGALDALERSAVDEPDHLERFETARARVAASASAAELAELPEQARFVARLVAVERSLERARQAAIDAIVGAQAARLTAERGRSGSVDAPALPAPEPFRASLAAPGLLALARGPVFTHVDKAVAAGFDDDEDEHEGFRPELPEEDTLAALLADDGRALPLVDDDARLPLASEVEPAKRLEVALEPESGEAAVGLEGELAQLRSLARGFLEDVGANGNLRRSDRDGRFDWDGTSRFETRLCHALDALRALGTPFRSVASPAREQAGIDVLDEALRYGRESLTADPQRAFARTIVLGSVAGEDAARALVLALKQSPRFTHRAQIQALAMAPSEALDPALARLCEDRDPGLLRVALEAMAERGRVDFAAIVPLVEHVDDSVRTRAYRALAYVEDRATARALLEARLAAEEHDLAALAAAEALTILGGPAGLRHARARLTEEVDEGGVLAEDARLGLMRLLGVAGGADDHELLRASYRGRNGEAAALGLHGHFALAEVLYRALVAPGEPHVLGPMQRLEAAAALVRITGAPILVEPNDRFAPSTAPSAWTAWWDEFVGELEHERRLRWGNPWSAVASVAELEADGVPVKVREWLALELAVALGEPPIATGALVLRQRRALGRARASVEARLAEGTLGLGSWR